jgi:tetratricopeptide (TPR) repeat protein
MRFALILICLLIGSAHGDATSQARAHYRLGLTLFDQGSFEAARNEFEAGYRLQPLPLFLFNAAQAARRAGDSLRALALYRQFVAADPYSSQRAEAEKYIGELAPSSTDSPNPKPVLVVTAPPPPPPVRWSRDKAGATLTALGAVAAVAGAILVGVGGARVAAAHNNYASFDSAQHAMPLLASGGVALGTGAVLLIGGAIRFGVVARRAR